MADMRQMMLAELLRQGNTPQARYMGGNVPLSQAGQLAVAPSVPQGMAQPMPQGMPIDPRTGRPMMPGLGGSANPANAAALQEAQ